MLCVRVLKTIKKAKTNIISTSKMSKSHQSRPTTRKFADNNNINPAKVNTPEFSVSRRIDSSSSSSRSTSIAVPDNNLELLEKRLLVSFNRMLGEQFAAFEDRLQQLETRLSSQIEEVRSSLNTELGKLKDEVETVQHDLLVVSNELEDLRRQSRLHDVVVRGIPVGDNDNPRGILNSIASTIGHKLSPYVNVFRPRMRSRLESLSENDRKISPLLIVKFPSANEQQEFLVKTRQHGTLPLKKLNLGFSSNSPVYINESLTSKNSDILRTARKLLKRNLVSSVFTRRGFVFVQLEKNKRAQMFTSAIDLNEAANSRSTGSL